MDELTLFAPVNTRNCEIRDFFSIDIDCWANDETLPKKAIVIATNNKLNFGSCILVVLNWIRLSGKCDLNWSVVCWAAPEKTDLGHVGSILFAQQNILNPIYAQLDESFQIGDVFVDPLTNV